MEGRGLEVLFIYLFNFFVCLFGLFRAASIAYRGSQARGRIRAVAYTAATAARDVSRACGNAGSLTHGVRPGIGSESSWILVRFVSTESRQELLEILFNHQDKWFKQSSVHEGSIHRNSKLQVQRVTSWGKWGGHGRSMALSRFCPVHLFHLVVLGLDPFSNKMII